MIRLKNTKAFRKIARQHNVKYVKSVESRGGYIEPVKNSGASEMDMRLVIECLYANVPSEFRVKKC